MPFFPTGDGSSINLDWDQDKQDISARLARGETYYGTLAGAVLYGGVQATAFDKPMKTVKIYNGAEALAAVSASRPLPEPVGVVGEYRIVVLEGQFYHPPLHPSQISAA